MTVTAIPLETHDDPVVYGTRTPELLERFGLVGLLAVNGAALAGTLALSKAAQNAGVAPAAYGFWMTFGGGAILLAFALVTRRLTVSSQIARYWIISGLLSMSLPQHVLFLAVTKTGAGFASVVYAFPTLATWVIARAFGQEPKSAWRLAGVVTGAVGAVILLAPGGGVPRDAAPWLALALIAPVILGAGNVYRKVAWPEGASPVALAAGMALSASLVFLAASFVFDSPLAFWTNETATTLVAAQIVVATVQFAAFFALQKIAQPVVFSLIGQVALVFGLALGWLAFGETYDATTFVAIAVILIGWALVSFAPSGRRKA